MVKSYIANQHQVDVLDEHFIIHNMHNNFW